MIHLPTGTELRQLASRSVNTKSEIEQRLAVSILLQLSLAMLTALEKLSPESPREASHERA